MKKKVLRPFDLEKAKAGAEICTRDGLKARIVCYDKKGDFPIVALITIGDIEHFCDRTIYGLGSPTAVKEYNFDLFIVEYEEEQHQFKPFDKVLVRCEDDDVWFCDLFSHCSNTKELPFVCVGDRWNQCIPYEGNENLLGTTNNPE